MKRIILFLSLFIFPIINGCSIFIVNNLEQEPPCLSCYLDGFYRSDIENEFGGPINDCYEFDNHVGCEYDFNYYDCDKDATFELVLYDLSTLFLSELVFTPMTLVSCRNVEKIMAWYDSEEKVYSIKYITNSPTDQSQERKSNLGKINTKYNYPINLLSLPGFGGYRIKAINKDTELEAIKETDFWVLVMTPHGTQGWVAKDWIQN